MQERIEALLVPKGHMVQLTGLKAAIAIQQRQHCGLYIVSINNNNEFWGVSQLLKSAPCSVIRLLQRQTAIY